MAIQNFKIKHGLNLGDHELIDPSGNINLPNGKTISIDGQPLTTNSDWSNITNIPLHLSNIDTYIGDNFYAKTDVDAMIDDIITQLELMSAQ